VKAWGICFFGKQERSEPRAVNAPELSAEGLMTTLD